jgi:hypothetical protein
VSQKTYAYPERTNFTRDPNIHNNNHDMLDGPAYPQPNVGMGPQSNPIHPNFHSNAGAGTGTGFGPTSGHHSTHPDHPAKVVTSTGKTPESQARMGKMERTLGRLVGSENLQAKGAAKEQEARAIQSQRVELANAERLEAQAGLARDRANAHAANGNIHGNAYNIMSHGATGLNAPAVPPSTAAASGMPPTERSDLRGTHY